MFLKNVFFIVSTRKRLKRFQTRKSFIAKQRVERGHEHVTKKKQKLIPQKVFKPQTKCKCTGKKESDCPQKITIARQEQIFSIYYQEMCWSQKTPFIRSSVKRQPVKSKKSLLYALVPLKRRDFSHIYSLKGEDGVENEVCRDFYLNCIQVTPNRIFNALQSHDSNAGAVEHRGKSSKNKTSEFHHQAVKNFIERIPKYESHYGRSQSQRQYLHHSLNLVILYKEYKGSCDVKKGECVSEHIFRQIFNTEYNLSFKRRHTDTCRKCDETNNCLKSSIVSEKGKTELKLEHQNHMELVEKTRAEFLLDVASAVENDDNIIVLTFDLEKTLETPYLSTSVAFYKRQLWTYNLCIYNEAKKKASMYVWSENQASRGGQEVGSCLLKHLKENLNEKTTKVILYSDSCGRQNRNIKVTLLLKKFLHDLPPDYCLDSIEQKYFVSGHSYNSCDRCFGLIEKNRKTTAEIYTPTDWVNVIKESKKNAPLFDVNTMQSADFVSSINLQSLIVNRKKTSDGVKVNWFSIRSLKYLKNEPFNLHVVCMDGTEPILNVQKKKIGDECLTACVLPCLFPDGNQISKQKYDDLIDLLKYVPIEHHEFFKSLSYQDDKQDYGLASDVSDE